MEAIERLVPYELNGNTYYLLYSVLASQQLVELSGKDGLAKFLSAQDAVNNLFNTVSAAEIMIKEGARYKEVFETVTVPIISADTLSLICTVDDFNRLVEAVATAIIKGSQRQVEEEPPKQKKQKATGTQL